MKRRTRQKREKRKVEVTGMMMMVTRNLVKNLSGSGDNGPFILPEDWAVNKFLPMMSDKVFKELHSRYQIPDHIPICLFRENERCYSRRIADANMYDAMFAAGLRLPLMALHRQLVDFLGLSISQITQNAWRIFISAEILQGHLSGGKPSAYTGRVFYCYRPHYIASFKGMYHFTVREKDLKLVSDMPDSNRNWKSRYFFVKGTDWVCYSKEWVTMPCGYFDNTWAFVRDSSQSRQLFFFLFCRNAPNTIYFL